MVPRGLKPVRRRLATGETRVYWYHRATGKRLADDPATAAGMIEVAELDALAAKTEARTFRRSTSFGDLWDSYSSSPEWRRLKPRTRSDYQAVRDWLGPAAEKVLVGGIKPKDILRLRDKAEAGKGRRFANYVVQVMRLVLEWGRQRGWRTDNPAAGISLVRRPSGARQVNRPWSEAEVEAFASAAPPQLIVPFALGLFAGLRQGDALTITWAAYNGASLAWTASKNGERCVAPVSSAFQRILEQAKAKRGDAVQICLTSGGTAWSASGFRASFFKLVRRLEQEEKLSPGCTFHGLRHTVATMAREGAESEFRVAAAIGDRSTAMASLYGRDADRRGAQISVLEAVQKRFANIDWKTGLENDEDQ